MRNHFADYYEGIDNRQMKTGLSMLQFKQWIKIESRRALESHHGEEGSELFVIREKQEVVEEESEEVPPAASKMRPYTSFD